MAYRPHACPFCSRQVTGISKFSATVYQYDGCGCRVQFDAHGYPHLPRPNHKRED